VATQRDVRRLAMKLDGVVERRDRFAFDVVAGGKAKGVAWVWLERIDPKKARVPNPAVLAVRTMDLDEKAMLLAADDDKLFTEPHYDGYPAVMVRLDRVTAKELDALLAGAHRAATAALGPKRRTSSRSRRTRATRSRAR
jgi:hypothetical protein